MIEVENTKVTANGNDVATSFSFSPVVIYAADELEVVITDPDGVVTEILPGASATTYAVVVSSYPGTGSITYPAVGGTPLPTGWTITIRRVLDFTQPTDLQNQGGYYADTQETMHDRHVARALQLREELERSVKVPLGSPIDPDDLIADIQAAAVAAAAAAALVQDALDDLNLIQATETDLGIAELATQAEADAGTNDTTIVTPLKMATSLTNRIASQAQAEAGAVNTNASLMTPLRTAQAIAALVSAAKAIPTRQTVLSGPVTTDGLPNFGGSTGSTTVTASGTLVATAANGEDIDGQIDRVGSITDPSWTGLSTNGTMFLYLDIGSDGTCTPGAGTLAPTYRFGGADVTTNGQFTFNVQEMVGKVGNGSAAAQTYRVYVGEVTVSGGVVSAIVWYALKGRYRSAYVQNLPGTTTTVDFADNLGTNFILGRGPEFIAECTTIDSGWQVGEIYYDMPTDSGTNWQPLVKAKITRNTSRIATGNTSAFKITPKAGGAIATATQNSWKYALALSRGW